MNSIGNQNNTKDAGQRTLKEQSNCIGQCFKFNYLLLYLTCTTKICRK